MSVVSEEDIAAANDNLNNENAFARISEKLRKAWIEAQDWKRISEELAEKSKDAAERATYLAEIVMPEAMDELGVSAVTLSNGQKIVLDAQLYASIPGSNKEQAHGWLRDNNHGDLIKTELNIKFGRSEDNMVKEIKERAKELGLNAESKEAVHPMTLKAFAREQTKLGKQLPQDLFAIFTKRVVNLKG